MNCLLDGTSSLFFNKKIKMSSAAVVNSALNELVYTFVKKKKKKKKKDEV